MMNKRREVGFKNNKKEEEEKEKNDKYSLAISHVADKKVRHGEIFLEKK